MTNATTASDPALRYFDSIAAALAGLDIFLRDPRSQLANHGLIAQTVVEYIARLENSFECWRNQLGFVERFRISRAESGFPVFQNVLELEKDKRSAETRIAALPSAEQLRGEMADFILRHRDFPTALRRMMAERLYLERVSSDQVFAPLVLPRTIRVSVNPNSKRPYYVVHWGAFDGSANLPLVYMAVIEDSSPDLVKTLLTADGRLDEKVDVPLPVEGLLNPDLAHRFDDFCEKNSAYTLSPATIATNLDQDFETLHPKQLRRFVLGPFYSAGVTENNSTVSAILDRVSRPENAWLLTWTLQDVFSKTERPGRRSFWSSEPARQEFHIETDDLEAARQGVSAYEKHALVPHEAYQAIYAAGEAEKVFAGFKVHVLSKGQVVSGL